MMKTSDRLYVIYKAFEFPEDINVYPRKSSAIEELESIFKDLEEHEKINYNILTLSEYIKEVSKDAFDEGLYTDNPRVDL